MGLESITTPAIYTILEKLLICTCLKEIYAIKIIRAELFI